MRWLLDVEVAAGEAVTDLVSEIRALSLSDMVRLVAALPDDDFERLGGLVAGGSLSDPADDRFRRGDRVTTVHRPGEPGAVKEIWGQWAWVEWPEADRPLTCLVDDLSRVDPADSASEVFS